VKALARRAARWPSGESVADSIALSEFLKVVRSIHINAAKEVSAAAAVKQLATPSSEESEESEDAE
jgi:hypothetical protein